jgi:hypothetical protein
VEAPVAQVALGPELARAVAEKHAAGSVVEHRCCRLGLAAPSSARRMRSALEADGAPRQTVLDALTR